jgi:hypothetical protein
MRHSLFAEPVRLDVRLNQETRDRLELLARSRQQPIGGVIGALVDAEFAKVPVPSLATPPGLAAASAPAAPPLVGPGAAGHHRIGENV